MSAAERPSATGAVLAGLAVAGLALAFGLRPGEHHHTATEPPVRTEPVRTEPPPPAQVAAVVTMTINRFVPERVTVRAGQTVEWKNTDASMWHSVTADPERVARPSNVALPPGAAPFHSGEVWPGETFRWTFEVPGLYKYFCQPHEYQGMLGEVEVLPR